MMRYTGVCQRLIASTVFRGEGRVRINVLSGTVDKVVPADDVTLGFAALLRQLFHRTEEASFDKVRQLLSRGAHAAGAVAPSDVLRLWRDTHGTVLKHPISALIETMARSRGLLSEGGASPGGRPLVSEDITPRDLVDAFLYGDQLHYGKGREALERWRRDETTAAMIEMNMRSDALMLAHFYSGVAGVVRVVVRSVGRDPDAS